MTSVRYLRVVAIDFGTRRIGIARSDPLGMFAQPVGTVEPDQLDATLDKMIREDGIERIIVGYPLSDRGEENRMTAVIDRFVGELAKRYPSIPVETVDEHRSSQAARKILVDSGASRKKRNVKGRVDTTAACVILQSYLDTAR
jgi:putative Holliday junction resolvase